MKRSILLMICMWSVIAVIIVGVIITGLSFYGFSITGRRSTSSIVYSDDGVVNYSDEDGVVVDEQVSMDNISSLKLDMSAGNVTICYSDDDSLRVVQYGKNIPEQQILEVSKSGSTARVKSKGGIQIFSWGINTTNNIDIYIPEDYSGDLHVGLSAGDLNITDDFSVDDLEIKVSAGSFNGDSQLSAKYADVSLSAGGLDLTDLIADSYSISASAGSIRIKNLTGSGKVSSSAGKIRIDSVDITDKINLKSSAGSIEIALAGNPSLDYDISVSAGSISTYFDNSKEKNITGKYGNGDYKKLEASSSAGSITITEA